MDDLLNDFLAETSEHLEAAGSQLVQFEIEPTNAAIIGNIFRLVHTIKGTCGFLGLNRLEALAHATEAVISRLRDGGRAAPDVVTTILAAVDRIKLILGELERHSSEPTGDDEDLISELDAHLEEGPAAASSMAPVPQAPSDTTALIHTTADRSRRSETIRVEVSSLERIMALVSELVLTRNQLIARQRHTDDEADKAPLQRLSSLTSELQDSVMRARMQPLNRLFARLPRLVRELSAETRKKLILTVEGGDVELDRQLVEVIRDPLTHILRNAADHGIELPEERLRAGKAESGSIRISASHEAGYIAVSVADDGKGLDLERIKAKALSRNLATAVDLEAMPPETIYRFIFVPAFSTATSVTNISGRGIGLDVVRENIETIGGSISVTSTFGKGTSFNLKIPLTLAIAPALIVEAAAHRFALPQQSVVEVIGLGEGSAHAVERVQSATVLRLRGQFIPLVDLCDLFKLPMDSNHGPRNELAIILRHGGLSFGVIVDAVADVQEIVVKPLGVTLSHIAAFSGHTILGDGSVVLILDPVGIARMIGFTQALDLGVQHVPDHFIPPREKTRLVLFNAGEGSIKGVPLSLISRIESSVSDVVESTDGMMVVQYREVLMPLLPCGTLKVDAATIGDRPVLILGIGGESIGLIVEEIIDIVEDFLDIEIAGQKPGTIGAAKIRGDVVEVVDISFYMKKARPDAMARGVISRFSVLLIDDRLFFRDMLSPILTAAGYKVTTASSGRDALLLLSKGAVFHAIITDTDMPDMDGYALAKEIKKDRRNSKLPIIALAAHGAPIIAEAAAASGMCGAVGKFDRAALLTMLRTQLDGQGLGQYTLEERIISEQAA